MPSPTIPAHLKRHLQTHDWPGRKALLLVHGIGNAGPGDYQDLTAAVRQALGPAAAEFAIYQLFYDVINDWFAEKSRLAEQLARGLEFLGGKLDGSQLAQTSVEVVGDVLWPVLSQSARLAVRELYLTQLKLMVQDGRRAGIDPRDMQLNVIGHSLGCFHTYEALHAAARLSTHCLRPDTDGIYFRNVILMASPVQMIRTVGLAMGSLISRNWNSTLQDERLSIPAEIVDGEPVRSIDRFVSITGRLDPVGGHFLRRRESWAYMDIEGQESYIDDQDFLDLGDDADLAAVLKSALREREAPRIGLNNPHSWLDYVRNHETELRQWLTA